MADEPRFPTLAALVTHYMDHYPGGAGHRKLTLGEAARMTGIPKSTLQKLRTGETKWNALYSAQCLAGGLGIPPEELDAAVVPEGKR